MRRWQQCRQLFTAEGQEELERLGIDIQREEYEEGHIDLNEVVRYNKCNDGEATTVSLSNAERVTIDIPYIDFILLMNGK